MRIQRERWFVFDHPSGVSDVSAVKNTGEAAALVCAEHISSKRLGSSSFKWETFFQPGNVGGAPVDIFFFSTLSVRVSEGD